MSTNPNDKKVAGPAAATKVNATAATPPMTAAAVAAAASLKAATTAPTLSEFAASAKLTALGSASSALRDSVSPNVISSTPSLGLTAADLMARHLDSVAHRTSVIPSLLTTTPGSAITSAASSLFAASTAIKPTGLDPSLFSTSPKLNLGTASVGLAGFNSTSAALQMATGNPSPHASVLGIPPATSAISLAASTAGTPRSVNPAFYSTTPNPILKSAAGLTALDTTQGFKLDGTASSYLSGKPWLTSAASELSPFVASNLGHPLTVHSPLLTTDLATKLYSSPASSLFNPGQPGSPYLSYGSLYASTVLQLPISTGINSAPIFTEPAAAAKIADFEEKIRSLRQEVKELASRAEKEAAGSREKTEIIDQLETKGRELQEQLGFEFLLSHVNTAAAAHLIKSTELRDQFLRAHGCDAFVMSVDIRQSTEMMLRANSNEAFALFITKLCGEMESIIKDSFGVVEKFTGDGVLAFFPTFFSGKDAGYYALQTAERCHAAFDRIYRDHRSSFEAVLTDVGLGIGIDFGEVHLAKMAGSISVVGKAVVHACRLSSAPRGVTLVNQKAFQQMQSRFEKHCSMTETERPMKHGEPILCYQTQLTGGEYAPEIPDWARPAAEGAKAK